ncbi:hypothetical protein LTR70_002424 [Exophiala xenobiotica]|uniref:Uncharacterized protein n=1 Tax=Lithohypha guttulata TaxID=1690604 RepID=A0ABR0KKW3_9EURO|nr:hypothetical protein LTR24_001421 [Lithohypha guttulata]KAK5325452.1 hypothetical protein LTR70_002424 [Exophiala xenobiotica]
MASNSSSSDMSSASSIAGPWRPRFRSSPSPSSSSESLILAGHNWRGRQTSLSASSSGGSDNTTTSRGSLSPSPTRLTRNSTKQRAFRSTSDAAQRAKATDDYKEAELSFKVWLLEKVIEHHNSRTSHFTLSQLHEMMDRSEEKRAKLKAGATLSMEKIQQLVAEAVNADVKFTRVAKGNLIAAISGRWHVSDTWFVGHVDKYTHDEWTRGLEVELQKLERKTAPAPLSPAPQPVKKESREEILAKTSWR